MKLTFRVCNLCKINRIAESATSQVFQNYSFDRAMFLKHGCDVARDPGKLYSGLQDGCVEVTHASKIQEYPRL